MATTTRHCPMCADPFTWTSRHPNRRFCTARCKARWWRTRHRPGGAEPAAVRDTAVRDTAIRDEAGFGATPLLGSAHTCPNCGEPINIVSLLFTLDDAPART